MLDVERWMFSSHFSPITFHLITFPTCPSALLGTPESVKATVLRSLISAFRTPCAFGPFFTGKGFVCGLVSCEMSNAVLAKTFGV